MIAKARVAQSTACSSSFAAAGLAPIEGSALPWLKAPLFAVGPKLCGEGGIKCKHSPLGEGAPVRTLRRMRFVHSNRWHLPPIIGIGRPGVPPLRAGVVSPRRATARAAPTALREPCLKSGGRVRTPAPTANLEASLLFVGAGHWPARRCTRRVQEAAPYSPAPAVTCSSRPGAVRKLHPLQFSTTLGPSGPAEIWTPTQISTRRKFCEIQQIRVPRNGVRGEANMSAKRSS